MTSTRIPRKLDPAEIRVLGSLLEKEQTTPEAYPLTVNSLLLACNQKTNREPVMELTEGQTPGELRTRSERMHPFASVEEVEEALQRMAAMDEPLVLELPRRPGQKEIRWTHLVGDVMEPPPPRARAVAEPELPAGPLPGALSTRVAKLEEIVAKLAEDVEPLKSLLS